MGDKVEKESGWGNRERGVRKWGKKVEWETGRKKQSGNWTEKIVRVEEKKVQRESGLRT